MHIMQLVKEGRKLKAKWQTQKTIWNKRLVNAAFTNLKEMLKEHNNNKFNAYISKLSTSERTDYFLWKATKKKKQNDLYLKHL